MNVSTERITVFGEHEDKVLEQLRRCVDAEDGAEGVLCADGHYGYSQPVGGAVAYREHVSPAGVGYDIGCGNKAVCTNLTYDDVVSGTSGAPLGAKLVPVPTNPSGAHKNEASLHAYSDGPGQSVVARLADEIERRISFGVGVPAREQADHPVLDEIRDASVPFQRDMLDLAAKQLGTVGGGNHYVDVFRDEVGRIWVGVHFGSRGFGHKTASRYFGDGPMDKPPELLAADSERGQEYVAAMELAGRYAYAGRDIVVDKVLSILGATAIDEVHNHHNYAWREEHKGEWWWVVRKGCTPAFPGQRGFVGATMAGTSVILEGMDGGGTAAAFYSTVHGAGRAMSRTAAAGKSRKRWACLSRDCDWVQTPGTPGMGYKDGTTNPCPKCGHAKLAKRWVREVEGTIDWPSVAAEMRVRGIELRGANAEEAPGAYKDLGKVLGYHAGTIRRLHELEPLIVVMAPGDVADPYKD